MVDLSLGLKLSSQKTVPLVVDPVDPGVPDVVGPSSSQFYAKSAPGVKIVDFTNLFWDEYIQSFSPVDNRIAIGPDLRSVVVGATTATTGANLNIKFITSRGRSCTMAINIQTGTLTLQSIGANTLSGVRINPNITLATGATISAGNSAGHVTLTSGAFTVSSAGDTADLSGGPYTLTIAGDSTYNTVVIPIETSMPWYSVGTATELVAAYNAVGLLVGSKVEILNDCVINKRSPTNVLQTQTTTTIPYRAFTGVLTDSVNSMAADLNDVENSIILNGLNAKGSYTGGGYCEITCRTKGAAQIDEQLVVGAGLRGVILTNFELIGSTFVTSYIPTATANRFVPNQMPTFTGGLNASNNEVGGTLTNSAFLTALTITNAGTGGTSGTYSLSFSTPNSQGSGAAGTVTVSGGKITGVNLTAPGSGYGYIPTVTIDPTANLTGAIITPSIAYDGGSNYLPGVDTIYWSDGADTLLGTVNATIGIVNGGSGGTPGTYALSFSGGGGTGMAGTFTIAAGTTRVGTITITSPGSGYTSFPTPSFAAASGLTGVSVVLGVIGSITFTSKTAGVETKINGPVMLTNAASGNGIRTSSGVGGTVVLVKDNYAFGPPPGSATYSLLVGTATFSQLNCSGTFSTYPTNFLDIIIRDVTMGNYKYNRFDTKKYISVFGTNMLRFCRNVIVEDCWLHGCRNAIAAGMGRSIQFRRNDIQRNYEDAIRTFSPSLWASPSQMAASTGDDWAISGQVSTVHIYYNNIHNNIDDIWWQNLHSDGAQFGTAADTFGYRGVIYNNRSVMPKGSTQGILYLDDSYNSLYGTQFIVRKNLVLTWAQNSLVAFRGVAGTPSKYINNTLLQIGSSLQNNINTGAAIVRRGNGSGYQANDNIMGSFWNDSGLQYDGTTILIPGRGFVNTDKIVIQNGFGVLGYGTVNVTAGTVTAYITSAGSGGTNGTYTLTFTGGGGSGAAGTVTVSGGKLTTITMTNNGSGYTSSPTVTVSVPGLVGAVLTGYHNFISGVTWTVEPTGFSSSAGITVTLTAALSAYTILADIAATCRVYTNTGSGMSVKVNSKAVNPDPVYITTNGSYTFGYGQQVCSITLTGNVFTRPYTDNTGTGTSMQEMFDGPFIRYDEGSTQFAEKGWRYTEPDHTPSTFRNDIDKIFTPKAGSAGVGKGHLGTLSNTTVDSRTISVDSRTITVDMR